VNIEMAGMRMKVEPRDEAVNICVWWILALKRREVVCRGMRGALVL
jgi:hypothetical protein